MRNYFSALGLEPGEYTDADIARRFEAERAAQLARLHDSRQRRDAWTRLDELHLGFRALKTQSLRASHCDELVANSSTPELSHPHRSIRRLIAASFEGGLLRYSRRRRILDFAAQSGVDEFETQILIAEEQYGSPIRLGASLAPVDLRTGNLAVPPEPPTAPHRPSRAHDGAQNPALRLAATGAIAAAMTICLAFWLGI